MDVTGWTIEQRIRLPDWCFPNRQLIGCYGSNNVGGSDMFFISEIALPDQCILWEFHYFTLVTGNESGYGRAGLRANVPANVAQMNTAQEFYPYFGMSMAGPNMLPNKTGTTVTGIVSFRKGIITGGKKLVLQIHNNVDKCIVQVALLVSGLPTDMAGWLEHSRV